MKNSQDEAINKNEEQTLVEDKTPETKKVEDVKTASDPQPMRRIVIEFNNNSINITKAEISSNFELQAILENVLRKIATN